MRFRGYGAKGFYFRAKRNKMKKFFAAMAMLGAMACQNPQTEIDRVFEKEATADGGTFSFTAFGDMPYAEPDFERMERLVQRMNDDAEVDFIINVGDLKSGSEKCTDEFLLRVRSVLDASEKTIFLTPGDNDWTDCHREKCGNYDPLERLIWFRKAFYSEKRTLGKTAFEVKSQGDAEAEFSHLVENQIWRHKNVVFGTLHIVGSNNGRIPKIEGMEAEWVNRNAGNIAWQRKIFEQAKADDALGVVLSIHANPFPHNNPVTATLQDLENLPESSGFREWLHELVALSLDFGKPVLLIHGDFHFYIADKPFMNPANGCQITHFDRVQVFGAADIHAVKFTVNPANPQLFEITPFLVPENSRTQGDGRCKY